MAHFTHLIHVTLNHEIFNDAMERRPLVADSVPSLCQCHKILHGLWCRLTKESNHNATSLLAVNFHVKENLMSHSSLASLL